MHIGQILSLQIGAYQKHENKLLQERQDSGFEIISNRLLETERLFEELKNSGNRLMEILRATGIWGILDGQEFLEGNVPSKPEEREVLLNFLKDYFHKEDRPFVTHSLDKVLRISDEFIEKGSGILALSISKKNGSFLIWFKQEQITSITWGGEPKKDVVMDNGHPRLLPRASFEEWKTNIRGECTPWVLNDLKGLTTLKSAILANLLIRSEKMEERQEELEKEVAKKTENLNKVKVQLEEMVVSLRESNEELKNFAYVTSHDLQEPLRQISTFTQLMERRLKDTLGTKEQNYMQFIVDGTENMQNLIDDLLQYSRLTRKAYNNEEVDLNELLNKVLELFRSTIKATQAVIHIDALPTVNGKKVLLQQLFQNLLGNALKYRKPGTPLVISIGVEDHSDSWQFMIKDNGIGISEEFYEIIFQLFKRLHTKQAYKGNGMGLTLCQKIVYQHQGRIWVESKPGVGSSFYFTISKNT